MSSSFDALSWSERIAFWQDIEHKIDAALRQCEGRLAAEVVKEVSDYLEHNELGLAWETLAGELLALGAVLPESARQLMLEAGTRMGFQQAEGHAHALWRDMQALLSHGG